MIKGNKKLHVVLTILIILITMLFSFTTDCLGIALEINVIIRFIFSSRVFDFFKY